MRRRIVIFDSGEQVLIQDSNTENLHLSIEPENGAKIADEINLDINDKEYKELANKAKTNSIDIATINAKRMVMSNEKNEPKIPKTNNKGAK